MTEEFLFNDMLQEDAQGLVPVQYSQSFLHNQESDFTLFADQKNDFSLLTENNMSNNYEIEDDTNNDLLSADAFLKTELENPAQFEFKNYCGNESNQSYEQPSQDTVSYNFVNSNHNYSTIDSAQYSYYISNYSQMQNSTNSTQYFSNAITTNCHYSNNSSPVSSNTNTTDEDDKSRSDILSNYSEVSSTSSSVNENEAAKANTDETQTTSSKKKSNRKHKSSSKKKSSSKSSNKSSGSVETKKRKRSNSSESHNSNSSSGRKANHPGDVDTENKTKEEIEQEMKRQRRLMKNRASAKASRERKKRHVQGLEQKVQNLTDENNELNEHIYSLEEENEILRQRLSFLGQPIEQPKTNRRKVPTFTPPAQNTTPGSMPQSQETQQMYHSLQSQVHATSNPFNMNFWTFLNLVNLYNRYSSQQQQQPVQIPVQSTTSHLYNPSNSAGSNDGCTGGRGGSDQFSSRRVVMFILLFFVAVSFMMPHSDVSQDGVQPNTMKSYQNSLEETVTTNDENISSVNIGRKILELGGSGISGDGGGNPRNSNDIQQHQECLTKIKEETTSFKDKFEVSVYQTKHMINDVNYTHLIQEEDKVAVTQACNDALEWVSSNSSISSFLHSLSK